MNAKDIGLISELKIATRLVELGYEVLQPFGDNYRYDLAIIYQEKLYRIQVKTGQLINGVIKVKCTSITRRENGKDIRDKYLGQVEYIGVYCPQVDQTYIVSMDEIGDKWDLSLRIDPPKNNQKKKIWLAESYEI